MDNLAFVEPRETSAVRPGWNREVGKHPLSEVETGKMEAIEQGIGALVAASRLYHESPDVGHDHVHETAEHVEYWDCSWRPKLEAEDLNLAVD